MSWGFEATNTNGQVLVSSETRNLHFVGKAAFARVINSFNVCGGMRQFAFRINCNVFPMPFFTMPTSDYYSVPAIRQVSAGLWEIEVMRSGTSEVVPEVYVFSDPRGVTSRNTDYGMVVLRDDGTPSFDSRLSPLVVTGGISVSPPSNPRLAGPGGLEPTTCGTGDTSSTFTPDNANSYSFAAGASKPIYYYPSIAQAEREVAVTRTRQECIGFDYGVCIGYAERERWNSYYWAFYRGGIKVVSYTLYCGWIAAAYGCHWDYSGSSSLFGINLGGGSGSDGVWPYTNETLNLAATAVITTDGSKYD